MTDCLTCNCEIRSGGHQGDMCRTIADLRKQLANARADNAMVMAASELTCAALTQERKLLDAEQALGDELRSALQRIRDEELPYEKSWVIAGEALRMGDDDD